MKLLCSTFSTDVMSASIGRFVSFQTNKRKTTKFVIKMLIISVTSKITRWMCHRVRLACQKKLKITTNQSKIEQQKQETETCLFRWSFFCCCYFLFSSWEILNENHNSQFSCQHARRLRWQTLAPCSSPTTWSVGCFYPRHGTRISLANTSFSECIFLHQPALTVRCHSQRMQDVSNTSRKKFSKFEQFNHSNLQWKIHSIHRLNGQNEIFIFFWRCFNGVRL